MQFFTIIKYIFAVSILVDIVITTWIIVKNPKNLLCRAYFLFMCITILWEALFWIENFMGPLWRGPYNGLLGPIIFIFMARFLLVFRGYKYIQRFTFISFLFILPILIASFHRAVERIYYGYETYEYVLRLYHPWATLYYLSYLPFILIIIFLLFRNYFDNEGVRRIQAKYVFIGLGGALFITFGTNVIISFIVRMATQSYDVNKIVLASQFIGAVFISWISLSTAYAITRYRFGDIKVGLRKSVVNIVLLGISLGLAMLLVWALQNILSQDFHIRPEITVLLAMLILLFSFDSLKKMVQKLVDRFIFTEYVDLASRVIRFANAIP